MINSFDISNVMEMAIVHAAFKRCEYRKIAPAIDYVFI